jgi:hypothetical protein
MTSRQTHKQIEPTPRFSQVIGSNSLSGHQSSKAITGKQHPQDENLHSSDLDFLNQHPLTARDMLLVWLVMGALVLGCILAGS